jgi:hypothetical protein
MKKPKQFVNPIYMSDSKIKFDKMKSRQETKTLPITLQELFTPPYADGVSILTTLFGQGILVNISFVVIMIYNFFSSYGLGPDKISFDSESMQVAITVAVPLIGSTISSNCFSFIS